MYAYNNFTRSASFLVRVSLVALEIASRTSYTYSASAGSAGLGSGMHSCLSPMSSFAPGQMLVHLQIALGYQAGGQRGCPTVVSEQVACTVSNSYLWS